MRISIKVDSGPWQSKNRQVDTQMETWTWAENFEPVGGSAGGVDMVKRG